jgi:type IV secretion system protein TrbL
MVRTAASAMSSPLKRASASVQSSFSDGGGRAAEATGGMGPTASGGGATNSSVSAPDWAKRMKRGQAMSHGVSTAAHAIRSGDAHGGGSSVNLSERDH